MTILHFRRSGPKIPIPVHFGKVLFWGLTPKGMADIVETPIMHTRTENTHFGL